MSVVLCDKYVVIVLYSLYSCEVDDAAYLARKRAEDEEGRYSVGAALVITVLDGVGVFLVCLFAVVVVVELCCCCLLLQLLFGVLSLNFTKYVEYYAVILLAPCSQ